MGRSISLDCQACKQPGTMHKARAARFGAIIRLIGIIIVIPSVLGILLAVLAIVGMGDTNTMMMAADMTDAERAGTALGMGIGYGMAIFLAATSLVSGLVGWLLLSARKVYKCEHCGFILDRA